MTISAVVTETNINASVTQLSNSVALTETTINASVSQTPISANVTTSPISASVTGIAPVSVAVSQTNISASVSGGGSGGVTNHALLSNLDYASAAHTGFQATLTADVDYLTPATAAATYPNVTLGTANGLSLVGQVLSLALASAGTTGALSSADWTTFNNKQSTITFPLAANLGGTGVANLAGSTLTLGGATTISTGGTIALGGFTLTIPATLTVAGLGIANIFSVPQMIDGTTDAIQLRVQGHSTQTSNLLTFETSTGAVGAALSGVGAYKIYDLAQLVGYSTFVHDHADNDPLYPRTFFYGYAHTSPATNYILYAASGDATGTTQIPASFGVSTNADVKQADSYQFILYQNTTKAVMATLKAEAASGTGTPIYISTKSGVGNDSAIIVNNNTQQSVAIGVANSLISTAQLYIKNRLATNEAVIIEAAASQSDNIIHIISSTGSVLTSVSANGVGLFNPLTTTTDATIEALKLQATVSTASTGGAAGFGVSHGFYAETATNGTHQQQGLISTSWIDATNATRKAKLSLSAYDTAARLGIEIEASGTEAKLGFYGVATIARAVLATGAGATVDNVITALQNLGLVKQS